MEEPKVLQTIIGSLKGREGLQLLRKGGDRKRGVGKMSVIEIHGLQVWKLALGKLISNW